VGRVGIDPAGQVLGVVGLGDIGLAIAHKPSAVLDIRVHYFGPRHKNEAVEASIPGGAAFHDTFESLLENHGLSYPCVPAGGADVPYAVPTGV
jgi:lactate dehydrogenase-like 2-hydroxyacid dehydrogenase